MICRSKRFNDRLRRTMLTDHKKRFRPLTEHPTVCNHLPLNIKPQPINQLPSLKRPQVITELALQKVS